MSLQRFSVLKNMLRNVNTVLLTKRNVMGSTTPAEIGDFSMAKPYKDIPGPKPFVIMGNAWRFIPGIGELSGITRPEVQKSLYNKYGKIMKISKVMGKGELVILFDPDDVETVFRNEGPTPFRTIARSEDYYRIVTRKDIFQGVRGLIVAQGEEWQKFRKKVNQVMMQPKSTKLYVGPIGSVANDFIDRIRNLRDDKQEMPADFNNELNKWALESIVYIALDTRLGCLDKDLQPDSEPQKVINAVNNTFECVNKLEYGLPIWKFMNTSTWRTFVKSSDYIVDMSMRYIYEAMKRMNSLPEDPDRELTVLEKILARDPDPRTGIVMALDMIMAGVDTTSYSMGIILSHLAKNPDKQQKLFEEIKRLLPDKSQPLTSEMFNEFKYLKSCIKESMRITPTIFASNRKLTKDVLLSEFRVPKGTRIMMPTGFVCKEEKYFERANEFIPERWLKDGPYSNTKNPFLYYFTFWFWSKNVCWQEICRT